MLSPDKVSDLAAFYAREDIVAKIHPLHEFEKQNHYGPSAVGQNYWQRVELALRKIPAEYREAALALFSNVVYLTSELLRETLNLLAYEVTQHAANNSYKVPADIHLFAIDHPGLVDDFFDAGAIHGWQGRQDNISQRSIRMVSNLLDNLLQLTSEPEAVRERLQHVFTRPLWILLTDNAFSGGSVASDLEKLTYLCQQFSQNPKPSIISCAQLLTEQAKQEIVSVSGDNLMYGIYFNNSFRVNDPTCNLFQSTIVKEKVLEFCRWFGKKFFSYETIDPIPATLPPDADSHVYWMLAKHRKKHGDRHFSFGWRDSGYTLVLQRQCPTNSVPALWYPQIGYQLATDEQLPYDPPFRRNPSRITPKTAGDDRKLETIKEKKDAIFAKLWSK